MLELVRYNLGMMKLTGIWAWKNTMINESNQQLNTLELLLQLVVLENIQPVVVVVVVVEGDHGNKKRKVRNKESFRIKVRVVRMDQVRGRILHARTLHARTLLVHDFLYPFFSTFFFELCSNQITTSCWNT